MAYYSTETRLAAEEVFRKAITYFGPGGLGLELCQQDPCRIDFTGGGGHVTVAANTNKEKTTVDLETREWDFHVRQFMHEIAR